MSVLKTREEITRFPTAILLALALAIATTILVAPPLQLSVGASGGDPLPGPCETGYVAPTPVLVAVTETPIVVNSTTTDYFVLYVERPNPDNPRRHIPISVTRGEAGTTTLEDSLRTLSPDKYRVEKYQVAQPGDLDGDCLDDITELDALGVRNPINPNKATTVVTTRAAFLSRDAFEEMSNRQEANTPGFENLDGLEHVKFMILGEFGANPSIYFIDSNDLQWHKALIRELRNLGAPEGHLLVAMKGNLVYHPNVIAPDGSLGMYRFSYNIGSGGFSRTANLYQLLASAMPFLEDNLAYYPKSDTELSTYKRHKWQYDASRVNILLREDILPDVDYIPLNQAEGYGRLRLMADGDDPRPGDIPIFESLPNDLPRVAGSITTVPQTPLSHVNLRAIQNGVPNAFLRDILKAKEYTDLIGKHVYFAVAADGFTLREATKAEVDAHHAKARPTATQTLTRDLSVTTITSLANVAFADWNAFGVKAANIAELSKLNLPAGTVPTGYAVPFYFYDEFMKANGFYDDIDTMLADQGFQSDYAVQESMLKALRKKIKKGTTPAWIIKALEDMHAAYPDGTSLRYRSSTNNEDLPAFNGAGLYSSKTQDPDETATDGIDKSIKAVWASLWNYRAFLERDYYRVDHKSVSMGVLVHPNYSDEKANGVAVSHDPISFSPNAYYVNTQIGEDLVTNPESKSYPEQLLLDANGKASVLTRSNHAAAGQLLMTDAQMLQLRRNLEVIHNRFTQLYQVKDGEPFAIEIEFKITAQNQLAIKQARPWVFAETLSLKPTVSLAFAESSVKEGTTLRLELTRQGGGLSSPLDVELKWTDSGGKIQGTPPASVQFPAGQKTLSVSVQTVLTSKVEPGSTIEAQIKTNSAYVVGTPAKASVTVTDNSAKPEVSISAGTGITEGGSASFTISANPAAAADLDASVTVTAIGDFGVSTGQRTVTIPTTGSATFTVGTTDDSTDEADGSVTATVNAGSAYTVSSTQGTAIVVVSDDDGGYTVNQGTIARVKELAAQTQHGAAHVNRWNRVLLAFGEHDGSGVTGGPMTAAEAQDMADRHSSPVWDLVVAELTALEAVPLQTPPPPPPTPEVNIAGAAGGTEGDPVTFTLTASPAPTADLPVSVTITTAGDYGAGAGQQTVTIPTSGSATLTIATTDDQTDEPDGSVTATLASGSGYTIGALSSETATVADDDDPVQEPTVHAVDPDVVARVQALAAQTQHGAAHVNRWNRVLLAFGEHDGSGVTGGPMTAAEAQDMADRHSSPVWDEVVTELTALAAAAAQDTPPPPPPTPEISVSAGGAVTEGGSASFTISASPAPSSNLDVSVTVSASGDYGAGAGKRTVTIPTSGSATFTVGTTDDDADEADGSVTATVNAGSGYTVSSSQGAATVAVADDDDPPVVVEDPVAVEQDEPDGSALTACDGRPTLLISSPTASRGDASVDFEVSLSCLPGSSPTIILTPLRDGKIDGNVFVDLTSDQPSATVTVAIGGEDRLGLVLVWSSGLADKQAQGDVVFTD